MEVGMKSFLYFLLATIAISTSVFAGTRDPSVDDKHYLDYGTKFNFVGKLCGVYEDQTAFCASAVVIREKVILTAAHVVQKYKSAKLIVNDNEYKINRFIWPKEYNENKFGRSDIAIGYADEEVKLDFYPDLYDKNDELNKLCCISGYGITGTFVSGSNLADMKKRAGSNIIEDIQEELLIIKASRPNDRKKTSLEFIIASGDSGGGLFIDGKLAGINSCITGKDSRAMKSNYETESCHTRVSVYRDWILSNIDK